jgi:tetratricopeptide (TPR) repeat protein
MQARFRAAWLALCLCAAPLRAADEAPAVRILRTGGLKVESAALLVSGEQGGSIHVAVLPLLFPAGGAGGKVRVPIILEIDGPTLLKGNTGSLLRIEICLYALSASGPEAGGVQGSLLETIEIDLSHSSGAGAAVERSGVQYAAELALPPGDYSLRALVRNALTGEVGLRILNLAVHDPAAGALLLAPAFANPAADSWLAALSKSAQATPAALADGGLPAAQPVLGVDQEARFELPLWKTRAPEALRVEILRPDGGRAAELPAKIEARREAGGLERLTVSFVPADLEPGRYLLRALVAGADAPAAATPFVLLATGNEGKVWAELIHPQGPQGPQGAPREAAASEPQPKRRRLSAGPVRKAYLDALHLLAAGDEPAARQAVAALEGSLLSGPDPSMPEDVAEIELGIAKDLSAAAPQSLLPVAILHAALYRDSQQGPQLDRRPLVTTHAREMVFSLAAMVTDRRDAARLLLGLAAQLVRSAPPGLSERAFRQVLTFDEDDETALLNLAVDAERHGRYPETVSLLERLLRSHSANHADNAEARLRLAVNLRRLGKPRDADKLLAGLIQGPTATAESWVLALAYQETGRALVAAGQLDAAETLLREGLKRLPGDEKLFIQLAGLFDLRHDPAQARQVLAAFKPPRGGSENPETAEAARNRYNRMPYEALDRVRSDLVRSLPDSLPSLAAALQHKGGP